MKLKKPRTCNRCVALPIEGIYCRYGYRMEPKKHKTIPGFSVPVCVEYAPGEPCPKPLTIKEFAAYMEEDAKSENPVLPIYK